MAKLKTEFKWENIPLQKCPTGITGLDEITFGGLPQGRPTLVCGSAGCGKTLLSIEFLYRGALEYDEAGVFMTFEEKEKDIVINFASLGFNLPSLIKKKKLIIDNVSIERREIEETGEYDLEGLFIRLQNAIDTIGAKRVVLDTIEALFSGFSNESILRAELRRLFFWLKDKGVTTIVTGEKGDKMLTKYGLEEYIADCVISLDHRVNEQIATRRLKIIKYRGTKHGTNEYPFLIGENGISVFPITSVFLEGAVGYKRISSGIKGLDDMLDGQGFYVGTTTLISGSSGSGKTSIVAHFVDSACRNGKKALYLAFEESENQIVRNMKSIGLELEQWIGKKLLKFSANRGTLTGLEAHLVLAHKLVREFKPDIVVLDPLSDLITSGNLDQTKTMLTRLLDFLKNEKITVLATDLTIIGNKMDASEVGISSMCDTWIRLSIEEKEYRKLRRINIIKARGISNSMDIKELLISGKGLTIRDIESEKEN
jgi:circadian clock protein KaiC